MPTIRRIGRVPLCRPLEHNVVDEGVAVLDCEQQCRRFPVDAIFVHDGSNPLGGCPFILGVRHPSLRKSVSIADAIERKSSSSHCSRWYTLPGSGVRAATKPVTS